MQPATSETKIKSLDLSICVHHYTLRAPCPKGQGKGPNQPVLADNSFVRGFPYSHEYSLKWSKRLERDWNDALPLASTCLSTSCTRRVEWASVGIILTPAPADSAILRRSCCHMVMKDHSDSLVMIVLRIVLTTVLKWE